VAVKGIGGFHLCADATSEEAVQLLRARKRRAHKPFAVMFPSMEAIRTYCTLLPGEAEWLTSPEAPIVILQRLEESSLVQGVAPGNATVGAMLPYTPLHHLLMSELGAPVVATSGNLSDEPIVTDEQEARRRLAGIADVFLIHDRPIARPMDDSVVRMARSGPIVLRRARGLVPRTIRLPESIARHVKGPVLAVGGHLKNTVALLDADRVLLSQHLGDLSTLETEYAVRQPSTIYNGCSSEALCRRMRPAPRLSVNATRRGTGQAMGYSSHPVPHHHAPWPPAWRNME
jgi:hydrogenase maturation protein HypF